MNIGFTIATINYLAHVKTLGDSLTAYNPDISFFVCIVGDKEKVQDMPHFSSYTIIDISSIAGSIADMRDRYNDFELCCALKPFFAEYIFNNYPVEKVLYFDSDILLFNSVHLALDELQTNSILITPHCISNKSRNDNHHMDLVLLNYGVYNAGFFGLRRSDISLGFINWWKDKMFTECYKDLSTGRYVDQIWLNLVPVYFDQVVVFKDSGYNMAIWNFEERIVFIENDLFMVNNDTPLVFFHFSGYDPNNPTLLSKNHNIHSFESRPDIIPIFEKYRALLQKNIQLIPGVNNIDNTDHSKALKERSNGIGKWVRKLLS